MVDLTEEMAELWASLNAPSTGRGRVIQIVSARRGEGASTVARELAFHAAVRGARSVWLVDCDLLASPQSAAIAVDSQRYGELGDAVAASPDGSMFFTVRPPVQATAEQPWPDAWFLAGHRVGPARWWVTRFRREVLKANQSVHILAQAAYWEALRHRADLVVVDTPPPDRSQSALTLAPFMDQTVMVVAADETDVAAPATLRDSIVGAGGLVSGLFLNRISVREPAFLKALLP
jgi:Mrp family chromosome partitioning ATPase